MKAANNHPTIEDFLAGKSAVTLALFRHFVDTYRGLGEVTLHPAKTMIGVVYNGRRIAWITQLGRNFIHIVLPFRNPYPDNLCFQKVAQVPGDAHQFNHHLRMLYKEDLNQEVLGFMKLSFDNGG